MVLEIKIPCNRLCDVEWCSRTCFERRGQIWENGWIKDNGVPVVAEKHRVCDWMPKEVEE